MGTAYLGTVSTADPLYEILSLHVFPHVRDPLFHVWTMPSRRVFHYAEERSRAAIIGKFFDREDPCEERVRRIRGEYDNLARIRGIGLDRSPAYVVRPISRDERIGLAVVEEYVHGRDLDYYLRRAIEREGQEALKDRLVRLASLLHVLHAKTAEETPPDVDTVSAYFRKILGKLCAQRLISDREARRYLRLMDAWLSAGVLQGCGSVTVHGDATPTNFLFTSSGDVVAIDLERMKRGDPAYDVGMVCGEVKHSFLWRTGNSSAAEPFIQHFLWSYAGFSPDPDSAFRGMTRRNPFYMAMTELRISRNHYLGWGYRRMLVREAADCLRWGLAFL